MDIQTKVNSHNRLLKAVRQNPDISNVVVPENSDNYEFSCTICDGVSMEFNLRGTTDLLVVKAEAELKDKNETEIYEIGSEITENTNVRFTSYENKLVFQNVVPLIKLEGVEGEKKIFNETMSFIQLMISHKDQLGCVQEGRSYVDMDFTGTEEDDDPYGFNDFDDKQPENKEAFDGGFDAFNNEPTMDNKPPMSNETSGFDIFDEKPKQDITEKSEPTSGAFDGFDGFEGGAFDGFDTDNDDLDAFLGFGESQNNSGINLNLFKDEEETPPPIVEPTPPPKPQQKVQSKPQSKPQPKPQVKQPVQPSPEDINDFGIGNEDDELADMLASLEVSEKNKKGNRKRETPPVVSPVSPQVPINGGIQFTPKKPIVEDEVDNNFGTTTPKSTKKEKRERRKQEQQPKQNPQNNNEEIGKIMQTTVDYKRAPEVVEQMKHLYAEMDQLFAQRKKQADYREETLNKFSERLDKREKELAIRAERIEQNFNDSKAQIAKTLEDFETQKKEIDFQWNKLKMEKEMIESQKRDIEEREALIGRMGELDDTDDLAEEIETLNNQVRELEAQIDEYKEKLVNTTEDYEAKIEELNEMLSNSGTETAMVEKQALEEEVRSLNEKIEDLNDEIADLNEDIDEINAVSAQKDQIIQSFKDRSESWKVKEAAYQTQIANAAANTGANDEIMQQNADLQEKLASALTKLRSATDKVTRLESENQRLKTMSIQPITNGSNEEDQATINRLNQELAQANAQIDRANMAYDELKSQFDQSRMEVGANVDKKQLAVNAQNSLAQIGIQTEVVPGAGELMLSGYSDECQVVVNIDAGILYVEKPIKRGAKYKAEIEKWNQEDIRVSYMLTDKKAMCKAVYVDVSKSAMDVLGRFNSLS